MTEIPMTNGGNHFMKFLVIDEGDPDELDVMMQNRPIHAEARKKGELPILLFPDHTLHADLPVLTQRMRGMKIYETDDPQQLVNVAAIYTAMGLATFKRHVIPITEAGGFWSAYEKYKTQVKG